MRRRTGAERRGADKDARPEPSAHRLVDGKSATAGAIEAPQALALNREPRADVERYDALREKLPAVRRAS